MGIKKDNLTDIVDIVSQPEPTETTTPQIKPPKGLNDYQVYTPDGEIIDLTIDVVPPEFIKKEKGKIMKVVGSKDKKGNFYTLVISKVE